MAYEEYKARGNQHIARQGTGAWETRGREADRWVRGCPSGEDVR